MKRFMKWTAVVILTPILLVILFSVLLYLPPVQNWAVKQVMLYASESTGMEISVGYVRLVFPLDLGVEGVQVLQPVDSLKNSSNLALRNKKDTVAAIDRLVVDVQLMPLFKKQVMVDRLDFEKMKLNTTNFVPEAHVKGYVGKLSLKAHGIDLGKEHVNINHALLADAKLSVELSDTVPPDTSTSKNNWKINVEQLKLKNTDFMLHMPGDTLQVNAYLGDVLAQSAYIDLFKGLYQVKHFEWQRGGLKYDNNFEKPVSGLDFNHLALTDVSLKADSLYYCDSKTDARIKEVRFKEKSGLEMERLQGRIVMDSLKLQLPDFYLKTSTSTLLATVDMDMNAFAERSPGKLVAQLHGSLGRGDLMLFMSDLPAKVRSAFPFYPLRIDGTLEGNMQRVNISGLKLVLPTAFDISADGWVGNLSNMDALKANVNLKAKSYHLGFLTAMLDPALMKEINIPYGMTLAGNVKVDGSKYATQMTVREGKGMLKADAQVTIPKLKSGEMNMAAMTYAAKIQARGIQAKHFLPHVDLYTFTGDLEAKGVGTDFLSAKTQLTAKAKVGQLRYGEYNLDNVTAEAHVANGKVRASVNSDNKYLTGHVTLDALTNPKRVDATVTADIRRADLQQFGVVKVPMTAGVCGHVDVKSDLKENHMVAAMLSDITVRTQKQVYRPVDVLVDLVTRRDTTHAVANCGDFRFKMDAHGGYKLLLSQLEKLQNEVMSQMKNRRIDQVAIRERFPQGHISLRTGKENFIARFIKYKGVDFKSVDMDLTASPVTGLNGHLHLDSLVTQGMQLDTIRALVATVGDTIRYRARIQNNKQNPQYVFRALLDGNLAERGSDVDLRVFDAKDKLGVDVGLSAMMEDRGIRVKLIDNRPVLGYKQFVANADNYLFLSNDKRVSANLLLQAADGMGVRIYSNDENLEALQDITVSLHKFELEEIMSVLPYLPDVAGTMNGDFHVIQTPEELSVSSNLTVDDLVYEKCPMGDVGSEFVYMPLSDGSHTVNGILLYNGEEVSTISGSYRSEGAGYLDADLVMDHMPLHFVNGFIPDQLVGLKGEGEGRLSVRGSLSQLEVNGELYLDSAYLVSVPYGIEMRFADDPVRIENSKLLLENFMMYANNNSTLNVQGSLDFSNMDKMMLDVQMRARNFLLVDAKENARSEAYGKAYVNFFARMNGPLSSLSMRGKLDVLGSTDMTYILRESQLTTDNQLDELVKFTDFRSGKEVVVQRPALEGFNMFLNLNIDEAAHIICSLNADHSNYIDLMGGGTLTMTYDPNKSVQLTGKYTLSDGEMKYSLPIIPLKTFSIQDGSYVEFTGDPMNPILSITATENVRSTVNEGEGTGRSVDFVCGVQLTQSLSKPGIQFIISAPNDMNLQDELNTMSVEERGKIAITMLASGMYLANGNTSSFSMNSALSSFLNSEINNLAGSAMRSIGLDLDMSINNQQNAAGDTHTDYNFKFAKRFWNNRLSFSVGGQVSTGAQMENATNNEMFFNNVELQYRLNDGASQYIRAFYDNNVYDWLEGQIGEYGIGFRWSRKLDKFSDIFRFKTDKAVMPQAVPADSTKVANPANRQISNEKK